MDEIFYDVVDLLKALISTPSVSREEQAAADIIENFLKARGCTTQRCGNNVWTIAPGYSHERTTLLLNSHIDTVRPVNGWTRNPFSPDDDGERIYGLGSNDAGASVVSLTAAFLLLSQRQQRYNLVFLASCEEEVSGKGGIEAVLPLLPKIDVALVGEPTEMHPAVAEKGLMVLDGEIAGKSGHAARDEGENAIYKALPMIERLRSLSFPLTSAHLGPVKISVTQISAGTQHNVVPDMCRIVVDVRTTDAYTNEQTLEMIRQGVPLFKRAAPHRAPPRHSRAQAFRVTYPKRPGSDAVPVAENRSRRICPLAHGRRIHHLRRNPGGYPNLLHHSRRAGSLTCMPAALTALSF